MAVVLVSDCDPPSAVEWRSAYDFAAVVSATNFVVLPLGDDSQALHCPGLTRQARALLALAAAGSLFGAGPSCPRVRVHLADIDATTLDSLQQCLSSLPAGGPVHVLVSAQHVCAERGGHLSADSCAAVCEAASAALVLLDAEGEEGAATVQAGRAVRASDAAGAAVSGRAWNHTRGSGPRVLQRLLREQASTPAYWACVAPLVPPAVLALAGRYGLYGAGGGGWGEAEDASPLWRRLRGWQAGETLSSALAAVDGVQPLHLPPPAALPRIGILGGAFNPPTIAHVQAACAALCGGDVDEVWLVPCGPREDKPSMSTASPTPWQRYAMTVLALEACVPTRLPIRVLPLEAGEEGALASHTLLQRLQAVAAGTAEFHLIIGADLLPTLPTWRHAEALLRDVSFLVLPRLGYDDEGGGLDVRPAKLRWVRPPLGGGTSLAPCSLASSTEARARLQAGASVLGLVPAPVVAFIAAGALYT